MPVMPQEAQEATEKAETGFALMEEGDYELELIEVQTTDKAGKPLKGRESGIDYWTFVLQIPEDAERYKKRRFYVNFSFSEKAAPIRRQILDAFGVPASVNTDDLVKRAARCKAHVYQTMIEQGPKKDQLKNEIQYFIEADPNSKSNKGAKAGTKVSADNF